MARGERGSMIIQRVATGFLDLFGLKTTGESPPLVSNELSAVVDATDLYTFGRLQYVSAVGTQNIATVTSIPILGPTVPPGFIWLVQEIHLYVAVAGAGISYKVRPGYVKVSTSFIPYGDEIEVLAGEICWAGVHFERPLILSPGDRLAFVQTQSAGAPSLATQISGLVVPLSI